MTDSHRASHLARSRPSAAAALLALTAAPAALAQSHAGAQVPHHPSHASALSSRVHWVVPHAGAFAADGLASDVQVTSVDAEVLLVDGIARTTLTVHLANPASRDAEATLLLPVPKGAAVSGFDFEGDAAKSTAQLLSKDEATSTYASIVAKLKDPALLEFAGADTVRSSVFPVPAGGKQAVRLVLESVMEADGERYDYVLPRSESLATRAPWNVNVTVRSSRPVADVYSPTHDLRHAATGKRDHSYTVAASSGGMIEPGPLHLSVIHAEGPVSTTIFTSADPDGAGGYFLMLAGIAEGQGEGDAPPREVTIVIDRSGSMAGEKFDQAIAAARQVLEGLAYGESIQIIDYSADVALFAPSSVVKTKKTLPALRAYLDSLTANGGTNLDGALQAALAIPARENCVPVVLFLTDGLATEGETREHVIRERALENNRFGRRVFTFGVGNDVNAPLLDAVADRSRGYATYVRPGDDVEVAIGDVFQDLSGPAVTDLAFDVADADGAIDIRLVRDLYPGVMPDLFTGDRLLLLGRYTEARPAKLRLHGTRHGELKHWSLDVDFSKAKPRNAFVRRLWAMRRVAALEDDLRQKGADPSALTSLKDDPRFGETVAEMLDLATTHGVLTDSTAFLALEGTDLGNADALLATACTTNYANNTVRSGAHGVSQQANIGTNRSQAWCNSANVLYDANGQQVAATNVQTIRGRTFFRRGQRWTDGCLALSEEAADEPDRTVVIGSPEYAALLDELTHLGRAAHLSMQGEILLEKGGETVLIKAPEPPAPAQESAKRMW